MDTKSKIQEDLKTAQLGKNELKVSVLRMLLSELHNAQIQKGQALSDTDIISIVQREVKKRHEAAQSFKDGKRLPMALKEEKEAEILTNYLPPQLSDEKLNELVEEAISSIGASGLADMGKVIGAVVTKAAGFVDGSRVSAVVKQKLSNA